MALHRLGAILICCVGLAGSCGNQPIAGQTPAKASVEVVPDAKATADVDRRATLALKQALLNSFPRDSASALIEAGLVKDGYDCGPNPSAARERACLKTVREKACEINTIVRSAPYVPEKAQVIRICEITDPAKGAD